MDNIAMHVCEKDEQLISLGQGVKRKILSYGGHMLMSIIYVDKTAKTKEYHSHNNEQMIYMLKGSWRLMCAGKMYLLNAGDSFYVEPNIEHGAFEVVEDSVFIEVFTPIKEDLLKLKAELLDK